MIRKQRYTNDYIIIIIECLCWRVRQVYRAHLQQVLKYQYPDHYGITLRLLLRGICYLHGSLAV